MKIVHVINGLEIGGAERMLARLAVSIKNSHPNSTQIVVSLSGRGVLGPDLQAQGIQLVSMNVQSVSSIPYAVWQLTKLFRRERPDIVQSWLYRSDLVAGLAARISRTGKIAWGIRCTNVPTGSSASLKLLIRLNGLLSSILPHTIVCCAYSAQHFHKSLGYDMTKATVIPNGFDFDVFRPSPESRTAVRAALSIADNDVLVGIVGRYDELKDFQNFISAAISASAENPRLKFVMIGKGLDTQNTEIYAPIQSSGLEENFRLLSARDDVATLMSAMDLFCLSSCSEGFPNVVVEAMGAALPCVVTNVGDAAAIIGDIGKVVPPRNAHLLAAAILQLASLSADELRSIGVQSRQRAVNNYSLHTITTKYLELYEDMSRVST